MVPHKGRLAFKQYIKNKPTRWEIKLWVLSEATRGYAYRFQVYPRKEYGQHPEKHLARRVVWDLTVTETGKNHHLYLYNNWGTACVVIGWCLWSIRVQTHKWHHWVAWLVHMIKVQPVILAGKDFQNSGRNENEKYQASVEVFNEKQAAEYLTQWEPFTSVKHLRSLPGKNYRKLVFESCVVESFPMPRKIHEWLQLNTLQLAELNNFHNEIKVSFPLTF